MDIEFPENTPPSENEHSSELFGPVVHSYTRKQAIADGFQVDVSQVAKEAGIKFPVFVTRSVFDQYVAVPEGVTDQDEAGRLWDLIWMMRCAIAQSRSNSDRLPFQLYVRNNNQKARLITLHSVCSALDLNEPQPAITIMMPGED